MRPDKPSDPQLNTIALPSGPATISDSGTGPALILLHGYPGSSRDFRWMGPIVEGAFRTVRINLPGFGGTPRVGRGSVSEMAGFVVEVMNVLDIEDAVFAAHSAGGFTAAELSATAPGRVRAIAFIASPGPRPHMAWRRTQPARSAGILKIPLVGLMLKPLLPRLFQSHGFPSTIPQSELEWTVTCAGTVSWTRHRDNLARIDVPTMVASAVDDPIIEPTISQELADMVPKGPRLHFKDGRHYIQKNHALEIGDKLVEWMG